MDDQNNNKRDFSDFFKSQKDEAVKRDEEANNKATRYHYSYGPFKSSNSGANDQSRPTSSVYQTSDSAPIEVSQLNQINQNDSYEMQSDQKVRENWAYPKKKKSAFKAVFASFLAGALIMGGMMYASDSMNLFTPNEIASENVTSNGNSYFNTTDNGNGSGISNAAASTIVRPGTIAEIAANSSPAVVKIETMVGPGASGDSFNNEFFREFFGDQYQDQQSQELRPGGVGSGFIFEKNGYILTNQHVINGSEEIYVTVEGHTEPFKAKLLGSDYDLDLAVLKIEGDKAFATLPLGDSTELRAGDWVTAIGNPIGFDHTVSVGVISADERSINIPDQQGTRTYQHLLQTDASINPGNSGGPLLNLKGEVIGINTAVSTQAQGIGFAIPTSTIVDVLDQLKNNENIPKPYIGVEIKDIDETWQESLGLESTNGSLIIRLESGSPAHSANLHPGDVVVKINDTAIDNTDELIKKVKEFEIGEKITLEFIREGKTYETLIIVGDRNKQ